MLGAFGGFEIGGMGAAALDHFGQKLGVFQHGAGPQVVAVKGLTLAVFQKQRLLQALQEALFPDIGAGIVDKDAGLHITCRIDMAVDAAAGHAAARKFTVILEIDAVKLLAAGHAADLTHTVFHVGALLGGQQQVGGGAHADRHIVEVPRKDAALADEQIQKFIAGDGLVVFGGVADGHAEGDLVAVHQLHGGQRLLEVALAAAAVIGFLEALDGDGDEEIADPQKLLAEIIIDEGAVGEGVERHIAVIFAQADDVLFADEGLAAGEQAGMGAQLLGLGQHTVHLLIGQALPVAVFGSPAAGAVHIAGGGGVHQNEPRDVAAVFFGVLLCLLVAAEAALIHRIGEEGFEDVGVGFIQDALDIMRPLSLRLARNHVQYLEGLLFPHAALNFLGHIHQLLCGSGGVLGTALLDEVIQHLFEGFAFRRMGGFFDQCHSRYRPFPVVADPARLYSHCSAAKGKNPIGKGRRMGDFWTNGSKWGVCAGEGFWKG